MKISAEWRYLIGIVLLAGVFFGFYIFVQRLDRINRDDKNNILHFAVDEMPPYQSVDFVNKRFLSEIFYAIWDGTEYNVRVDYLETNRALYMTSNGVYEGVFGYSSSDIDSTRYILSEPVYKSSFAKFTKRDSNEKDEGESARVGIHTDHTELPFVIPQNSEIISYTNYREVFLKLLNNELDMVIADKLVGEEVLNQVFPGYNNNFEINEIPDIPHEFYMVFPRGINRSYELIDVFNNRLKKLQNNGEIERILLRNGIDYKN